MLVELSRYYSPLHYSLRNEYHEELFGEFRLHPTLVALGREEIVWERFVKIQHAGTPVVTEPEWFIGNHVPFMGGERIATFALLCPDRTPYAVLEKAVRLCEERSQGLEAQALRLVVDGVYAQVTVARDQRYNLRNHSRLLGGWSLEAIGHYRQRHGIDEAQLLAAQAEFADRQRSFQARWEEALFR